MTTQGKTTRAERINSLRIIEEYFWMFLRHLHTSVSERLGEPGMKALEQGFRTAGRYRGESMLENPQTLGRRH